jgi:hypothetical protein
VSTKVASQTGIVSCETEREYHSMTASKRRLQDPILEYVKAQTGGEDRIPAPKDWTEDRQ